jgi:dihydropteroate synthase
LILAEWTVRDRVLSTADRTLIMGVVNVTPDSFSDGGRFLGSDRAIRHGQQLYADGADLVDVGGESTRPGAEAVSAQEEIRRIVPVISGLATGGIPVSVDTSKPEVAAAAIAEGALIVNDISAGGHPDMAPLVAQTGCGFILMHMQGTPRTMQDDPSYRDVTVEVRDYLIDRAAAVQDAGVERARICVDPGIGFGKNQHHNLQLLARLDLLVATGYPVLVGTSRKSFLGKILDEPDPVERDVATAATVAIAATRGAAAVRVHNVAMARQAVLIADAIVRSIDVEERS